MKFNKINRSYPRPAPTPNVNTEVVFDYFNFSIDLENKLYALQQEQRLYAPVEERNLGSFAQVASKGGTPGGHSVRFGIPTIVVTPPPPPPAPKPKRSKKAWETILSGRRRLWAHRIGAQRRLVRRVNFERMLKRVEEAPWRVAYWADVDAGFRPHLHGEKLERDQRSFLKMWDRQHHIVKEAPKEVYVPFPTRPAGPTGSKGQGKQPKAVIPETGPFRAEGEVPVAEVTVVRSVMLLYKIRALRRMARSVTPRIVRSIAKCSARLDKRAIAAMLSQLNRVKPAYKQFEMEDPDQSSENLVCDTKGEVTLQHPVDTSDACQPPTITRRRLIAASTSNCGEEFSLTKDWIQIDCKDWTTSHVTDVQYWEYDLPKVALSKKRLPQVKPFLVHQYATFDMEIMIQATGLKFMQGLLIAAFYYQDDLDADFSSLRRSRAAMVQRPHCFIDASTSNAGTLCIPYMSYQSAIQLTSRDDLGSFAHLGRLVITPFNQLKTKAGNTQQVVFTVSVRFTNAYLYGKTSDDIGERKYAEMLPMLAVAAAMKVLNQANADQNRDKPPYQGPPQIVQPSVSSSLCIGTNIVEPLSSLRLDARGQTPHPDLKFESMEVAQIANVYGFVKSFLIKTDDKYQTLVSAATMDAAPVGDLTIYPSITRGEHTCYSLPPVAVLSSLFAKWRGSLRFKFQFVTAYFHQVSLIVCYVPHIISDITYDQMLGCHYQEFNLIPEGPREFTFDVPYVANTPFWDRRYSTGVQKEVVDPPGKLFVFMKTRLTTVSNQMNEINVNVFVCGGPDFEVAVPCQPSIGLAFDAMGPHFNPMAEWAPIDGYQVLYIDSWSSAHTSTGAPIAMLRYGHGGQHLSQYLTVNNKMMQGDKFGVFTTAAPISKLKFQTHWTHVPQPTIKIPTYMIPLSVGDTHGYGYLACASSRAQLMYIFYDIVKTPATGPGPWVFTYTRRTSPNYDHCNIMDVASADWDWKAAAKYRLTVRDVSEFDIVKTLEDFWKMPHTLNLEDMVFENDEMSKKSEEICPSRYTTVSTGYGALVYGESFRSLKDYCRRWHPMAYREQRIDYSTDQPLGKASFTIPILPAGLALQPEASLPAGLIRDGPLPIIASFYRHFRGGLRFKFILNVLGMTGLTFWVQHRPDRKVNYEVIREKPTSMTDSIYNHGYASALTDASINPTLTIEIPFYQNGPLGLLQRPKFTQTQTDNYFSLGELVCGFSWASMVQGAPISIPITILWSLADDMTFYTPIGFPAMVPISTYEDEPKQFEAPEPEEVPNKGPPFKKTSVKKTVTIEDVGTDEEADVAKACETAEPGSSTFFRKVLKYLTGTDLDAVEKALNNVNESLKLHIDCEHFIVLLASQIAHFMATPTITHAWIALLSVLLQIGLITFNMMTTVLHEIGNVVRNIGSSKKRSEDDSDYSGIVSKLVASLYMCIGTIAGIKMDYTEDKLSISRVMSIFTSYSKGHRHISDGLKMIFETFSWLINRAHVFASGYSRLQRWFSATPHVVDDYLRTGYELMNPINEERILTTIDGYNTIDIACEQGSSLLRDMTDAKTKPSHVQVIMDLQRKLCGLRDRAARLGGGVSRRRAPFCIHFTGDPGVGKSQLAAPVVDALLTAEKVAYSGNSIWTYHWGKKHWDGCYSQPCWMADEFLPISDPMCEIEEISHLQLLNSCAPFIMPGAAIEDKGRCYAPELMWINSNNPYPNISSMRAPDAIWRRMNTLWKVEWTQQAAQVVGNIKGDQAFPLLRNAGINVDNFEHLQFCQRINPFDEHHNEWKSPVTLQVCVNTIFKEFHEHRLNQFHLQNLYMQRRITVMQDVDPPNVADAVLELNSQEALDQIAHIYDELMTCSKQDMLLKLKLLARRDKDIVLKILHFANIKTAPPPPVIVAKESEAPPEKTTLAGGSTRYDPITIDEKVGQIWKASFTHDLPPERYEQIWLEYSGAANITCPRLTPDMYASQYKAKLAARASEIGGNNQFRYTDCLTSMVKNSPRDLQNTIVASLIADRCIETARTDQALTVTLELPNIMQYIPQYHCPHTCFAWLNSWYCPTLGKLKMSDLTLLDVKCEQDECNMKDEYFCRELFLILVKYSTYWAMELKIRPDLIPISETFKSEMVLDEKIIQDIVSALTERNRKFHQLKSIGQLIGLSAIPVSIIAAFAYLWRGAPVTVGPVNIEMQEIHPCKEVTEDWNGEVSPAQYGGSKQMNNSKRAVVRRTVIPACKEMEMDIQTTIDVKGSVSMQPEGPDFESLTRAVIRNTRFLVISGVTPKGEIVRRQCRVLGICDRYILMPRHYLSLTSDVTTEDKRISMYYLGQEIDMMRFEQDRMQYIEGTDLIIYKLPLKFPQFKDIRGQLQTYDDLERGMSTVGHFVETIPDIDERLGQRLQITQINMKFAQPQKVLMQDVQVTLEDGILYNIHGKGMCGSVIIDSSSRHNIIGMHVAGGQGEGLAAFVVRDWFDDLMTDTVLTPTLPEEQYVSIVQEEGNPKICLDGVFLERGIVVDTYAHKEAGKTAFQPSMIHGVFPVLTQPSILSNKDERAEGKSPMKLGCEKHGKPNTSLPPSDVAAALRDYEDLVFSKVKPIFQPVQPLTLEESIMGSAKYPNLKPVEMNTSEGFPYTGMRPPGATNKSWLFNFERDTLRKNLIGISSKLNDELQRKQAMRERGVIPSTIFTDCLKDARLPEEKCVPGKTRIFSISPVDFTIQCRQYFSPFFQAFEKAGYEMEHAIGISVQKQDWTDLVNFMVRFDDGDIEHACGDYKAFGDTLAAELVDGALEIAIKWLKKYESKYLTPEEVEKNVTIRRCMKEELKNAYHMSFNVLYQTLCGMPSGCPLTVYLNTMVNSLYLRIVWRQIFSSSPELRHFDKFKQYVRFVTYGDDVWLVISKKIIDLFDNQIIHDAFKKMGIEYHDIMKGDFMRRYCPLEEVTFLKNHIKPHPTRPGKFLAALEQVSVTDCANWVRKSPSLRDASMESSYATLMLAYGHGPAYYESVRQKLTAAWANHNVHFQGRSWTDIDDLFYDDEIPPVFMATLPLQATPMQDRALLYARARLAYQQLHTLKQHKQN